MRIVVMLLLGGVAAGQAADPLARHLGAGTTLSYQNNGADQPLWIVDSVVRLPGPAGSSCAEVHLRRGASPSATRYCLAGDTLRVWDARRSIWRDDRPVGAGMRLARVLASGDTLRFETGVAALDTISGHAVPVILTTVITVDSTGRPKRRLEERYAVSLVTATAGRFEDPDPSGNGWVATQAFVLRAIGSR